MISPDARRLFIAEAENNAVAVFDLATGKLYLWESCCTHVSNIGDVFGLQHSVHSYHNRPSLFPNSYCSADLLDDNWHSSIRLW